MRRYRLTGPAQNDVGGILDYTEEQFGPAARKRYAALVGAAPIDVAGNPERIGSAALPDIGSDVRIYHLRYSRRRAGTEPVRNPRHLLVYRIDPDRVVVLRVLHDAQDMSRHLAP